MTDRVMFIRCVMAMLHGADVPEGRMDAVLDRLDIDELATLTAALMWAKVDQAAQDQYREDSQ